MAEVIDERMPDSSGIDGGVERLPLRYAQNQALKPADLYINIIHGEVKAIKVAIIKVQLLGR